MVWNTVLLKDIMPDAFDAATEALASAQDAIDQLADAYSATTDGMNEAQNLVNSYQAQIDELEETGFATIVVTPVQGSWNDILLNADNAPVNNDSMYSCGYINLTVAATESAAQAAYDALSEAMTSDFVKTERSPSLPDAADLVAIPDLDLPINQWEGVTLGDMFPGLLKTVKDGFNQASKALKTIQNTRNKIQEKISDLETARDKAQSVVNGLSATGQYQLKLAPALGGWMSRAASEVGAPPTTPMYVTGFAAVAVATDLAESTALYTKLQAVM